MSFNFTDKCNSKRVKEASSILGIKYKDARKLMVEDYEYGDAPDNKVRQCRHCDKDTMPSSYYYCNYHFTLANKNEIDGLMLVSWEIPKLKGKY